MSIKSLQAELAKLMIILNRLRYARPQKLQPLVQRQAELVVRDMEKEGYKVTIFQGFRSFEEQNELYAQGRTKPGAIVTNAIGGDSFHNYGVAVDIVFTVNGRPSWANNHPWSTLGKIGKKHGFEWGGDWVSFPDRPHLQILLGYSLEDFKGNNVDYIKYV